MAVFLHEAIRTFEFLVKRYLEKQQTQHFDNEFEDLDIDVLSDNTQKVIPVLIGPPGIGKTAMLHQMAKRNKWGFLPVHIAQIPMEMLSGIPMPVKVNTIPAEKMGKLNEITEYVSPDKFEVRWTEPEIISHVNRLAETHEAAILFFDDIHTADQTKQELFFELATERKLHGFKLRDNVFIVAAGNTKVTHGGKRFFTPILSRFVWMQVKLDPHKWLEYAGKKGIHPAVQLFFITNETRLQTHLLEEPESLAVEYKGFPTPRTWEYLSEMLYILEAKYNRKITQLSSSLFTEMDEELRTTIEGAIGNKAGKDFYEFIKLSLDIDYDAIFRSNFKEFLNITNAAKKYYLLFTITDMIASELEYRTNLRSKDRKIEIVPVGEKGKKLFKWLNLIYQIYQATSDRTFLAIVKKALRTSTILMNGRKSFTPLYNMLYHKQFDRLYDINKFDATSQEIENVKKLVNEHLSVSSLTR